MTIDLFADDPVQEFFNGTVAQQAERRVFNIPTEDLCAGSVKRHVDAIITMYCPGRLLLDSETHASAPDVAGSGGFT
ncbi:MAG: hypothetical protein RRA94_10445, partial [Bacteroidota bacterium]|nr:hypothetical protein [Bacteroidota bacterium]